MKQASSGPASTRRGFTLIELLVVILIIAVLAALIFPAISSVQKKGYQTTSMNNLLQWYAGYGVSVGDHDGEMPTDGDSPFNPNDDYAWFNRLPPGMKQTAYKDLSALGPDMPAFGKKSVWINPAVPAKEGSLGGVFCFNYGYNDLLSNRKPEDIKAAGVPALPYRVGRLQSPHSTILMGEKANATPGLNKDTVRTYFSSKDSTSDPDGAANLLFCDGHVELVKRSVFSSANALSPAALDNNQAPVSWLPFSQ